LIELLAEQLVLSMKKPIFRSYEYAGSSAGSHSLHLVKPLTYMNRSGDILPALMNRKEVESSRLIVVTDNMDLPVGRVRMKPRGSSAGHNGLKSVMSNLGTGDFFRLYVGIGRPEGDVSVVDHVLGDFSDGESELIRSSLERCAGILTRLSEEPPEQVMNEINSSSG